MRGPGPRAGNAPSLTMKTAAANMVGILPPKKFLNIISHVEEDTTCDYPPRFILPRAVFVEASKQSNAPLPKLSPGPQAASCFGASPLERHHGRRIWGISCLSLTFPDVDPSGRNNSTCFPT